MSCADQAALLARAARFVRAQFAALVVTFRAPGDSYDHEASFEWPGRVAVYWDGELQCSSAAGDIQCLASTADQLRDAGIDRARAVLLLQRAGEVLSDRARGLKAKPMPGLCSGHLAYLVQFRWPGVVRVISFRTGQLIVQSKCGEPTVPSTESLARLSTSSDLMEDERDPRALVRARSRLRSRRHDGAASTADGAKR